MTALTLSHTKSSALSLFLLVSLSCTTDEAPPDTKPEIKADEPAITWAGPSVAVPAGAPKANKPEPPSQAVGLEAPTKVVESEPKPAVDNQAARQKHGLGKQPKNQPWSAVPGLTAFEGMTALCLDYKLAADVAGERTNDEWTKYVAKRKGMKADQLAKVYTVWMAYALEDPNRGADPSGPEAAYCTWD